MELVPAPASTAGMAKTPVPTMLPTTSPVADVRPRVLAFCSARLGCLSGPPLCRALTMVDIEASSRALRRLPQ
jgi:hypothetical protein